MNIQSTYEDYIKEGDGDAVHINRKGMQLFQEFLGKKGGPSGASEIIGVTRQTLAKLRDNGYCAPETWEAAFNAIKADKLGVTANA